MATARKIAFNFIASSIGRVIGLFFSLASIGLTARALSTEGYGQFSTISAFLFLFMGLADLGLYSLMLREISRPGVDEKYVVSNFFTLRIISLAVFLLIAFLAVFCFPYPKEIKMGIIFCSTSIIFMSLSQLLMPIFQKYLNTEKAALAEVSGRVFQFLMTLFFFKMNFGLFWFLFALIFSSAITFIANLLYSKKHIHFSLGFDISYFKKILKMTLPIAISIALTMVYFRGNTIFLSVMQPQEDVGLFNLGYKVLENLIFFPAALVGLIMPFLSKSAVENMPGFKSVLQKSFNLLSIGAVPLAFGGLFFSKFIVGILGGKDFIAATSSLKILLFAVVFIFFGNLAGNALIALNLQKKLVFAYLFGAIFSILANVFLISKYSYNGAAIGTLLTEAVVTVAMFIIIFKNIRWVPHFSVFFKAGFAAVIMCFPMMFFKAESSFSFLILFFICFGIYFFSLYLIKGITKEEIYSLIGAK